METARAKGNPPSRHRPSSRPDVDRRAEDVVSCIDAHKERFAFERIVQTRQIAPPPTTRHATRRRQLSERAGHITGALDNVLVGPSERRSGATLNDFRDERPTPGQPTGEARAARQSLARRSPLRTRRKDGVVVVLRKIYPGSASRRRSWRGEHCTVVSSTLASIASLTSGARATGFEPPKGTGPLASTAATTLMT
jgi:hypothetical protein